MNAYAVAHLRNVKMGAEIKEYVEKIDMTLAPFGGRFIIHGGDKAVLEGSWPGDLIVIAFPDREQALEWYGSTAYQAIQPLRARNADGDVVIIDGVPADHRATDIFQG